MLELAKNIIETKHKHVLFIIIVLTLIFSMFLPSIEFRTNIEEFYPENDAVIADNKIEDNFGKDPSLQYIYVSRLSSDPDTPEGTVLSLAALQEEYNLTQRIRQIPGVVGTNSVAEYFHLFLSLSNVSSFLETNWSNLKDAILDLSSDTSQEQFFFLQDMLISKEWDLTRVLEGKAPDAMATIIIVKLNSSLSTEEKKNLANDIRDTTNNMPLHYIETEHTGADIMAYQVDEVSNETLKFLGAGIIILITVILYLSFRRLSYVLLPLLTLALAIIWTLGTMVILGLDFTALHVALLPLLIGLGIDDAVHVSRRYQEELRKGKPPPLSMAITMKSIGTAIFLTSLTTIIAFLSNGVSGVKPVKDFGIVCAIGIAYAFLLTVTFYVGMRYWLDRRGGEKIILEMKKEGPRMDTLVSKTAFTIDSHPRAVVLFVLVVTLLSIYGTTQVRTEFDVKEFLPEDMHSMEAAQNIEDNFKGGSYTTAYMLYEGEGLDTIYAMRVIDHTYDNIKNDEYLVSIKIYRSSGADTGFIPAYQITTPLTVIGTALDNDPALAERFNFTRVNETKELRNIWLPNNQDATDKDVKAFYDYLYENNTEVDPLSGETYGNLMRSVVHRNENGEYDAILIKLWVNAKTSGESRTVYNELRDDVITPKGSKVYITGTVVLLIQTVDSIQSSQMISTTIAVILACIILCLIYKDIELGLISILPVVLNITWILSTMALLSYIHDTLWSTIPSMSLNVLTVTITSLSIGLGIDYSIHVVQRFRENLFQEHESVKDAIHSTLEHTGSALFISAVTTVTGFGVLIFAPMPLIKMFGIITAASIVFSLLSCTILLPILLVAWANFHGHFKLPKDKYKELERI